MRTPAQVKADIEVAKKAVAEAFDLRDFEGAGLAQNAVDSFERELSDFDEEFDHYQDYVEMFEPVERPYRELPDSPECWSMAGA